MEYRTIVDYLAKSNFQLFIKFDDILLSNSKGPFSIIYSVVYREKYLSVVSSTKESKN